MRSLVVIIMAAGQGTRMKSDLPKVLHKVGSKTILESVVASSAALNPRKIVTIHGHGGAEVQKACEHLPVTWVEQKEQLGTGHAVKQAVGEFDESDTVLVLVGDIPLIKSETLSAAVEAVTDRSIGLITVNLDDPAGYGRIVRNDDQAVCGIVEHKDASEAQRRVKEINTGIMAMPGRKLKDWLSALRADNAQGEYYLTDVIHLAVKEGFAVETVQPSQAYEVAGINDRVQLAESERHYQSERARALMLDGVTIKDPRRIDVRGEVRVGRDVVIDVNVVLEGDVTLGNRVYLGPNSIVKDAVIEDDVEILPNCVIERSQVGRGSVIGPFARLRPEVHLEENVKVGNFVEIKKSSIAAGAKVNHLSYVGDAEIGAKVNVGAGTITCNYDGVNKHKTVIGEGAFIGSGTQLVAPVEVGADATIGAGSTITKNAEAASLTLSRSKQTTISGWKKPPKSTK